MNALVRVATPLTGGELVQGTIDGTPVLVSTPIDRYSMLEMRAAGGLQVPPEMAKVRAALDRAGAGGVRIAVTRDLRCAAGYGTSTADIAGALAAWYSWAGLSVTPETLCREAIAVEPSDGTMLPGLTLLAQRDGSIIEPLGDAPALVLLLIDPGGEIDTVAWSRRLPAVDLDRSTRQAVADLRYGLKSGDLAALGRAATRSAVAYQALLPSGVVSRALTIAPAAGALGVVRAHSGTVAGLLFPDNDSARCGWQQVGPAFPDCSLVMTSLINGGTSVERLSPVEGCKVEG